MRCSRFVPVAKRAKHASARPDQSIQNSKSASSSTLLQPNSNLPRPVQSLGPSFPRQARSTSSSKGAATTSNVMRRIQRESAKTQSCAKQESDNNTSTTLSDLHSATTVLPGHIKHPRMASSTSSPSSTSRQTVDPLIVGGGAISRPGQLDLTKAGGGRHPHPPTGNNSKLKHKCPFDGCPWRFATPYKLRRHIKSHTKETPYLCKECGRGFSVRYNLLMHIQTIHSQPQRFKCPVRGCKDAFHSQSRLNGHLRRIHKNDWKSLQGIKEAPKTCSRRGGSISSTDSSDSVSAAPLLPSRSRPSRLSNSVHKCQKCGEEFSSKAKLSAHNRIHSMQEKEALKCTVQVCEENCGKVFFSQDKLSRHLESHSKNSRQFCCPHKNCNRIFLRQTHLRNHLKIHTQDHQFICPVLDCSQKFSSEGAYNVHLNTHINYGYSCPHSNCDVTFLSQKRLAIHMQVVHGIQHTGSGAMLLDGIQPHLGERLEHHGDPSLLSAAEVSSPPSSSSATVHPSSKPMPIRYILDNDFLKHVDLPGLSTDDIKAVLSENEDWSGEQIDQFLRSAIDLSEIESKLSSLASYESDSGYSTYDVSPITTTAPANLNFARPPQMVGPPGGRLHSPHVHHPCPPLSLALLDHSSPSPLFSNLPFMTLPLQPSSSSSSSVGLPATSPTGAPPLIHDPMRSPCTSDGGFFSPHSVFNTPNQDPISFFPPQSPMTLYPPHPFPPPQDFCIQGGRSSSNGNIFSPNGPCFPDSMHAIGLPMPDPFMHELCQNHLPTCPLATPATGPTNPPFMDCSPHNDILFPGAISVKLESNNPCLGRVPLEMEIAPTLPNIKQEEEETCLMANRSAGMERRESLDYTTMSPTSPLSVSSQISMTVEPALASYPATPLVTSSSNLENNNSTPSPPPFLEHSSPVVTTTTLSSGDGIISESVQSKKPKSSIKTQGRSVTMKAKKNSPWPRSMNKANLLAFRERILNKLKKGQDFAVDPLPQSVALSIAATENLHAIDDCMPSSSTAPLTPPLIKCEASSPSSVFAMPVTYEQNVMNTTKRCLSEPADLNEFFIPLQSDAHRSISEDLVSSSSSVVNEDRKLLNMVTNEDADDLLKELNFNPDVFLSSNLDQKMLDSLGFQFNVTDEEDGASNEGSSSADAEIADLLSSAEEGSFPSVSSPPTTSMEKMPTAMDMDCIHQLLMDSGDCGSLTTPISSPEHSLSGSPTSPTFSVSNLTPPTGISAGRPANCIDGTTSPSLQVPSSNKTSVCVTSSCVSGAVDGDSDSRSFQFPEIFSVEGSMTLGSVAMAAKRQEFPRASNSSRRKAFLHTTHDPLLTAESHQVALFNAI